MITTKQALIIISCLMVIAAVTPAVFAETAKLIHAENVELTHEDAMTIAMAAVNTEEVGPITSVELEYEDGILVYAVEFTKEDIETDVKIDAQTGEIVKTESDLTKIAEEANEQ